MDETPESPGEDPFRSATDALDEQIQAWEQSALDDRFVAETTVLERATRDFVVGVRTAAIAFGRYPYSDRWLLPRFTDDLLESSIAVMALAREGVFNVGRRELRYLLEAVVKYVFVDQQVPGETPLSDRLAFLNDTGKVPRSSVQPVDALAIQMLENPEDLVQAVHSAFGHLSGYTHLSKRQLDERLRQIERGEYTGFESAVTLAAFNRLLVQTYDVVLTLVFEGIGPAFTGDMFVALLDHQPRWRFHRTTFVKRVSHHFDYKVERRNGGSG